MSETGNTPEEIVREAIAGAFESLIFEEIVLGEVCRQQLSDFGQEFWWGKISLMKPPLGDLYLVIRKDIMIQYSEAMIGMQEEEIPDEKLAIDGLGEMLNTIGGRLLAMITPENETFELGLPEVRQGKMEGSHEENRWIKLLAGENQIYLSVPDTLWN